MLTLKGKLELKSFYQIIFEGSTLEIDSSVIETVEKSFEFLKSFSEKKVIYGVNTGFGPMAQYKICLLYTSDAADE